MNNLGFSHVKQFWAWFIGSFAILFLGSLLLVILVKIHWNNGYAIFTRSTWGDIFLIFLCYNLVTLCFCFMLATLFSNKSMAVTVGGVTWLFTYIPYVKIINRMGHTYVAILRYVFFNTSMGLALDNVINMERRAIGYKWKHFFRVEKNFDQPDSVGMYIILFLLHSIIFLCIGFYVEQIRPRFFGKPLKWYYMINGFCHTNRRSSEQRSSASRQTKIIQVETNNKIAIMKLDQLNWLNEDKVIIRNFSEILYEDEIIAIMGHNGSGKTVLMYMLAGLIEPTFGTIYIQNVNVHTKPELLTNIGVAIKDRILFNDLTAYDNLTLFCKARGYDSLTCESEAYRYMNHMKLTDWKDIRVKNLSYGMRLNVAVCCAFIGKTKIVVLDEPTSGMDICTRKMFWRLLRIEKQKRTIVLTTHSSSEIELLADRIAIMSEGDLQCCGRLSLLKSLYLEGMRLVCVKGPYCITEDVTNVVSVHIPNITPIIDFGTQLIYQLEQRNSDVYVAILKDLESKSNLLNIEYCTLSEPSLGEIFLDIGVENASIGDIHRYGEILNGKCMNWIEDKDPIFLNPYHPLKGIRLIFIQIYAILLKDFIYEIRSKYPILLTSIVPILFTAMTYCFVGGVPQKEPLISFRPSLYKNSHIILSTKNQNNFTESVKECYLQNIFWSQGNHEVKEVIDIPNHIVETQELESYEEYIVGISLTPKTIKAWFNSFPLHSAPMSLNLVHNSLLHAAYDTNAVITVNLEPLDPIYNQNSVNILTHISWTYFQAAFIGLCMCIIWPLRVIAIIKERNTNFKKMQYISGSRFWSFWGVTYVYDLITVVLLSSLIVVILMYLLNLDQLVLKETPFYIFLLSLLTGVTVTLWNFLVSTFFKNKHWAYSTLVTFNLFGIACFFTVNEVRHSIYRGDTGSFLDSRTILHIMPCYSLCTAITKVLLIDGITKQCEYTQVQELSIYLHHCTTQPNCCTKYSLNSWEEGILPEISALIVNGIICLLCVWIINKKKVLVSKPNKKKALQSIKNTYMRHHKPNSELHPSIVYEQVKINMFKPSQYFEHRLICTNLSCYSNYKAESPYNAAIFLLLEGSECFGLYGLNRSGKTRILNMFAGLEPYDFGEAMIDGYEVKSNIPEIYERIGYADKHSVLPPDYTGRELLQIHSYLRGIPNKYVEEKCENLAKVLGFFTYYNEKINTYSDGHKKRLNIAIALLGNTSIICLDEPTIHIDEGGQRQLWNILLHLKDIKRTILLTTSDGDECELICNKIAIVKQSEFQYIGVPSQIKNEVSTGVILKIMLRNTPQIIHSNRVYTPFLFRNSFRLRQFMEDEFPGSELIEDWNTLLIYSIPNRPISYIYEKIEAYTLNLNIECFIIENELLPVKCTVE
ncbi:ATP-binding cassette sub-family A member 3-like isoform X2 [Teleopsis dalmanni]|nr:ATP-binding cassette sub-family A member 3-like isoform X2 [Teleopsis dalmanni]